VAIQLLILIAKPQKTLLAMTENQIECAPLNHSMEILVMSIFSIATWNVNSLRVRLPHVFTWLADVKPDVLALQETKMPDTDFPVEAITDAGYQVVFSGQKTYNGVAILSREKAEEVVTDLPNLDDPQRRVLAATIAGIRVIDLYIPNGESVTSDKYMYKLDWLKKLDAYLKQQLQQYPRVVVLGDFNIAPQEIDVHDPAMWEGHVLFSQPERQAFQDMLNLGFKDCFRMISPDEVAYSWWDYRMNAFRRKQGMRIDHILASDLLSVDCVNCVVDKAPRTWERPSDHTPVIAEFKRA
jgi:exodeoxyribonuclease-3